MTGYKDAKKIDLSAYSTYRKDFDETLMRAYRRDFDETKYIPFLIKDDELLEKYNEIREKVKNSIKKYFDTEPVYNEKHLKPKIKSYNGKINTNFYNKKERFSVYLFISHFNQFCF